MISVCRYFFTALIGRYNRLCFPKPFWALLLVMVILNNMDIRIVLSRVWNGSTLSSSVTVTVSVFSDHVLRHLSNFVNLKIEHDKKFIYCPVDC